MHQEPEGQTVLPHRERFKQTWSPALLTVKGTPTD